MRMILGMGIAWLKLGQKFGWMNVRNRMLRHKFEIQRENRKKTFQI